MSQVRGNFSHFAQDLQFDAIGKHVKDWIDTSSVNFDHRGAGFLCMSFASQLSGVGFLQISAYEIMGSTMGVTLVSNVLGSGFRWIPLNVIDMSFGDGVSSVVYGSPTASQGLATQTSIATLRFVKVSATVSQGTMPTSASNISVHILIYGLIISAPDSVL